jgi:hypothetical protein
LYSADRQAISVCLAALQGGQTDTPSSISCSARNTASRCRMKVANQIRFLAIT